MTQNKWHMHRLGLVDFWYYDDEEFYFDNGHMLLRGSNGSGKSVTMQSFIPLLLDGNKSSERLDPFGTRSRKIENYLIEEDSPRDDRIGYLYLEFKREDLDVYKTIGMGLRARKNKPVSTWYFVIEDNRRIKKDIKLFENNLAITKRALKNIIGDQLIESQGAYCERVNQSLFGFQSRDEYKEIISLLLQLRSPKLSNSLKPTMINEILNSALQPLSDEDLRPMTEAISSMDAHKDQLDALLIAQQACNQILRVFDQYNASVLLGKTSALLEAKDKLDSHQKQMTQGNQALIEAEAKKAKLTASLEALSDEQRVLDEQRRSMLKDDLESLVEEVMAHKQELEKLHQSMAKKEALVQDKEVSLRGETASLKTISDQIEDSLSRIHEAFSELTQLQKNLNFEEHEIIASELMGHLTETYNGTYTESRIKDEIELVRDGLERFDALDGFLRQHDFYVSQKDQYQIDIEQTEQQLDEKAAIMQQIKDDYIQSFYAWNRDNEQLKFNDSQLQRVTGLLRQLEIEDNKNTIASLINQQYLSANHVLKDKRYDVQNIKDRILEEKEALLKEITKLEQYQYEVPLMDTYMDQNRKYLNAQNIPNKAFYELLDFEESMPKSMKDNIEEVLRRSGILNVLCVNQKYKAQILNHNHVGADSYFFINHSIEKHPPFVFSESFYQAKDWNKLFDYFGLDGVDFASHEHGFTFNRITGLISNQESAKYIGALTREHYRQEQLAVLNGQLEDVQGRLAEQFNQLEQLDDALNVLQDELEYQPTFEEMDSLRHEYAVIEGRLKLMADGLNAVLQQIQGLAEKTKTLRLEITTVADRLGINASHNVFKQRQESLQTYQEVFRELSNQHRHYLQHLVMQGGVSQRVTDLTDDIAYYRDEISQGERDIASITQMIHNKESHLEQHGYHELKQQLDKILQRLSEIPQQINLLNQEIGTIIGFLEEKQRQKLVMEQELENLKHVESCAYNHFEAEVKLGYISDNNDAQAVLQIINQKYQNLKPKHQLHTELQKVVNEQRGNLQEYSITQRSIFDDLESTSRLDVSARYGGKNISIPLLHQYLSDDLDRQRLLWEDSDRILIEDIIINTLSKKIRVHIHDSRLWVLRMNRYMDGMNTSSGLKLKLKWKSRKADNEDELNADKLVALLEKDIKLLKDSDFKRLSKHFSSKITYARKQAEISENHESFHQIMRTIMDYRTWFDFKIIAHKSNEKEKELTNSAFFAYSGGEKAMSMYIPLFSAVAAKYEGAKADAPTIIALDEAFAGVDDNNIDNMFGLIEKFKFDFIMNSQFLWGDCPSVKQLAIHELYRPENARYVTIMSYLWNGNEKVLVNRL